MVKLLLRFYKSQDGSIFLSDREIEEIPLKEYRGLFSVVSQEIYLFNDTIRNNVCMYRDFSEDAIRAVLDEVGLSEMVSERGMDFLVGINGALLSGGQKQKVALARALLHDRPVFIFDEATSNTDIDFELRFRRMLNSRLARKTIIMITHNIDLLQAADQIVLMKTDNNKKKKWKFRGELLFLLPSIIGVAVFYFIPFCDVLLRSFQTEFGSGFAGIENYKLVVENKAFGIAVRNTAKFIAIYIPALLIFSLFLAVLLDYLKERQKLYKKIFLLPMAIPVASLVLIWKVFFDKAGLINGILKYFGIAGPDYFHTSFAFLVLGITYLWRNFGYDMLLWKTGVDAIEEELYEAAALDGAGFLRRFWYITLPQLKEMGFVIVVISIINSFKVFREAYLIGGDYPNQSIYMLQHLFNNWFVRLELGKLTAAAIMLALVVILFVAGIEKILTPKEKL